MEHRHRLSHTDSVVDDTEHKITVGFFNQAFDAWAEDDPEKAAEYEQRAMENCTPNEFSDYLTSLLRHYAYTRQPERLQALLGHPFFDDFQRRAEADLAIVEGVYLRGDTELAQLRFNAAEHQLGAPEAVGTRVIAKKMRAIGNFIVSHDSDK